MPKWSVLVIGLFIALGVVYHVPLWGTRNCQLLSSDSVPSPSGQMVAKKETKSCSPSDGKEVEIRLQHPGSDGGWIVFVGQLPLATSSSESAIQVRPTWLSESELQISFPQMIQVKTKPDTFSGLAVTYKPISSP